MEASDGEEEKSQKGSEEKEEVDSARRPARPQECGQETQGGETGREGCGETGSAKTETAVRLPSVAVAPGAGPAPNPAAAWSFTPWVRVVNGLRSVRSLALRTEPQTFSSLYFFSFSRKVFPEFFDFRPDYQGAVGLRRVSPEVFLMVILRHVEL